MIYRQGLHDQVKGNAILQASLEKRKEALHERRWALEQDVGLIKDIAVLMNFFA